MPRPHCVANKNLSAQTAITTTRDEDEEKEQKMTLKTFHKLFLLRLKNEREEGDKRVRERESR